MGALEKLAHIGKQLVFSIKTLCNYIDTSKLFFRTLVKSVYQKINFLISKPNYMLWETQNNCLNETILLCTQKIC